jgi:hypothetical protein
MGDVETMGPVDYLVVEFKGNQMTGEGIPILLDLVDRGTIRILDLAFMMKDEGGTVHRLAFDDIPGEVKLDFTVFEGASSGLLTDEDLWEAGNAIEPGNAAGILIYENAWAAPFAVALRRGGAQLVASGTVPIQALLAASSPS